jgi:pyridoxal phosphate enzyme (YggS family)
MAAHVPEHVPPEQLVRNLRQVLERIAAAAERCGRSAADARLVAVTKYVSPDAVRALLKSGVTELGENRVQNAHPKIAALQQDVAAAGARWRMIGHLQTNKARQALQDFATLDAIDSIRLLECLVEEAVKLGRTAVPCLAEINVSGEAQKHGLRPNELRAFLERASACPAMDIQGLMAMAPLSETPEATSRPVFRSLRELRDQANASGWYPRPLRELSMGMTQDYEIAVEEGATLVRVGSALYARQNAEERDEQVPP